MFIINKYCFKRNSNQQTLPIVKKPSQEDKVEYFRYNCLLVTVILLLVILIVSLPGNIKQSEQQQSTTKNAFIEFIPTSELEYLTRKIQLNSINSNRKYYDLNTTLMAIDSKHFVLKQEHFDNFQIYKDQSKIKFRCDKLFSKDLQDRMFNSSSIQPKWQDLSKKQQDAFTYDNSIKFEDKYEQRKSYNKVYTWSKEKLEYLAKKNSCGSYNESHCVVAFDKYSSLIRGLRGIVFSQESPWAEAALLSIGAAHITTVGYVSITTTNNRLTALSMKDFLEKHSTGLFESYDFAFSFSSLDQEGFGRGGEIDPYADLEMISRINCLLKPTGVFILGLPVGYDSLLWNSHRVYGYRRLSTLLKLNWVAIDLIGNYHNILNVNMNSPVDWSNQPIWILKKREAMSTMNSV